MVTATDLAAPLVGATSSMMTWEEVPCPMCRHDHWHPVIEGADNYPGSTGLRFAIVRCDRCGLKFTNPRPTFESMDRFYPIGYEPHRRASLTRKPRRRWYPFRRFTGRPCPERRSLPWLGEGRLLDFGCGGGEYLCRMREQGWNVTGMDASVEVVRELRKAGPESLCRNLAPSEVTAQQLRCSLYVEFAGARSSTYGMHPGSLSAACSRRKALCYCAEYR